MAVHFTPATMRFLRGLAKNNDRTWFEERRPVYEAAVKSPLLALVDQITAEMNTFAPDFVRPPHKIAMRIFRDTRFSPDKRPYKTHLSAWWAQRGLGKDSGAGFYMQIGPQGTFMAAGVYAPQREALLLLRQWLAEHHETYRAAVAPLLKPRGKLLAMVPIEPAALTRNPKGFPVDHPASDLLRARNWGVTTPLAPEAALSPTLAEGLLAMFRRVAPFVHLLNQPLSGDVAKPVLPHLF